MIDKCWHDRLRALGYRAVSGPMTHDEADARAADLNLDDDAIWYQRDDPHGISCNKLSPDEWCVIKKEQPS